MCVTVGEEISINFSNCIFAYLASSKSKSFKATQIQNTCTIVHHTIDQAKKS